MHDADTKHAIIYDHYYQFFPEHGFIQSLKKEGQDVFLVTQQFFCKFY